MCERERERERREREREREREWPGNDIRIGNQVGGGGANIDMRPTGWSETTTD